MRGALIHGVLLVVMLVYGYRTWTRDTTIKPDLGSIVLWDKHEGDLVSIELKSDKKVTRLERRGQGADIYWWGSETTIEKKAKPPEVKPEPPKPAEDGAGSGSAAKPAAAGSGSAGSGSAAKPAAAGSGSAATAAAGSGSAATAAAGSGSAATAAAGSGSGAGSAAPAVAEQEIRKTREFPIGEAADRLLASYVQARALRDLGKPTEEQQKDYKLNDAKTTLTVTFRDGSRSFLVGGAVYGGSDRYVTDPQSGRAYVLSKDLVAPLDGGESSLQLIDPRGFDPAKLEAATIEAGGKTKNVARVQTESEGQQIKTWGDPVTKKADTTIQNFIDNSNNLRPTEYQPNVKLSELTPILKLTFKDERDKRLGTLVLYKHERAGEVSATADLDPANPPPSETDYLIMTEKTRVPALVRRDTAQRTEQDIATVFSEHPSIDPKGNPLGTPPPVRGHGPHGGPAPAQEPAETPAPATGSAAPVKAGSAAPAKADAAKAGAAPAKADAPKAGAAPAKADAPKAGSAAPAKAAGGW